jgi:hypothetical protein
MRTSLTTALVLSLLYLPASAFAASHDIDQAKPGQGTQKPAAQATKPKPAPKLPLGFRAFADVDMTKMAASSTFNAVTGSSTMLGFGAGAELLNVWKRLFLRGGFQTGSTDGFRGFLTPEGFVSTGIPIDISVTNVELMAGWRSYLKKHPKGAWYVAGGLVTGSFSQTSPDADSTEDDSASHPGFGILGGFEWVVRDKKNKIVAGFEAEYKTIGGVLGVGGISKAFNEDDLGGFTIRGLIGIRIRK